MYAGERTRDELCFPIDITNAYHAGLSYLQKAIEIFLRLEGIKKSRFESRNFSGMSSNYEKYSETCRSLAKETWI